MTPTTSAMTPARARCTSGTETARCARSIPRQEALRAISGLPDIRNPSSWKRAGRGSSSTCLRRATSRWWIARNSRLSQLGTFPARNSIIRWRSTSRAGGCSSEHASPQCCSCTTSIPVRSWRSSRSGKTPTISSSTRSASASTSSAEKGGSRSCARTMRIIIRWKARSAPPRARAPGSSFPKKGGSTWPHRRSEHHPPNCLLIDFVESTKRFVTRTRHGARFAPHFEKGVHHETQRAPVLSRLSTYRRICPSRMAWLAARSCRRGFQGAAGGRAGVGQEQAQLARGHPAGKSRKRKSHFGQVRAGRREVVAFRVYGGKRAGGPCRKECASGVERQPRAGQVDTESGSLQGRTPRCEIRGTARGDVARPQKPRCRHRRSAQNASRHCFLDYADDQEPQARRGGACRPKRQSHDGDPASMSSFQDHSLGEVIP